MAELTHKDIKAFFRLQPLALAVLVLEMVQEVVADRLKQQKVATARGQKQARSGAAKPAGKKKPAAAGKKAPAAAPATASSVHERPGGGPG